MKSQSLFVFLFMVSVAIASSGQEIPLVYDVEDTGEAFREPVLPTFDELPIVRFLPDPFEWSDGNGRSTEFADWSRRRAEIRAEIEHYGIGKKPPRPQDLRATFQVDTLTVKAIENGETLTLTAKIVLPDGDGPFPAVIGIGFGAGSGSLPQDIFVNRKIATIAFDFKQVMAHQQNRGHEPINRLYPDQTSIGAYSAWSWGISRVIDGLELVERDLPIDHRRLAVTGCSFAGKMALFAGAFDERIALTIAQESGGGGAAAWRVSETLGNVETLGKTSRAWFSEEMFRFSDAVAKLPYDHHELMAMIAPRALLVLGNPDYEWLADESGYVSCRAAHEVWKTFGVPDRFGFSIVAGHQHCRLPDSQRPEVEAFVDKFLLGKADPDTSVTKHPFDDVEHAVWYDDWSTGTSSFPTPDEDDPVAQRSLKDAVGPRFKIGVGVSDRVIEDRDDAALIRQHFQILTPENCMKPQAIHPQENRWTFERTDAFAEFVRIHRLDMVGHCLVWAKDDRTAGWMMSENDQTVSRGTLLRRIEKHINTLARRYGDVVTMWDVVNEAIGDDGEGLLRDSVYSRTSGMDFIVTAFRAARAADPDAILIYNDYNGHKPDKRKKLIELLTKLQAAGAPVDAYGMQGHFELGDNSVPELRETFDELRKLGIKVVVSELDIDVVKRGRWWADDGKYRDELQSLDPFQDGLPAEVEKQMAEQYAELFRLFDEYSDIIARVSFWNLHDGQSWLSDFPWKRVNHPLLFDRNRQPKPAFDAVYEVLTE